MQRIPPVKNEVPAKKKNAPQIIPYTLFICLLHDFILNVKLCDKVSRGQKTGKD